MKRQIKAFTLIELLVVITIIGILATTWVAVFTKQLQWARDSTRINDIKLLESAAVQYFNDHDGYPTPTSFSGDIVQYVSKKVVDPKAWIWVCRALTWWTVNHNQSCHWHYIRTNDSYWLPDAAFKIWVFFEKKENYDNLANSTWSKTDGGNNNDMYEVFAWAWSQSWAISSSSQIIY